MTDTKTSQTKARKPRKPASKTEQLIKLLRAKGGADTDKIGKTLGWQAHTTRAAISRLRKGGHTVVLDRTGSSARYAIPAGAEVDHGA